MNEGTPQPKRRGRPPKTEKMRRDGNLTFRVRGGIREKLQAQADARGMSISEEIERRLLFSFDIATSSPNEFVLRAIAEAIKVTEMVTGKAWGENAAAAEMCFNAVKSAASIMLAPHEHAYKNDDLQRIAQNAGRFLGLQAARKFSFAKTDQIEAISTDGFFEFYTEVIGLEGGKGRLYDAMYNSGGLGNIVVPPADPEESEDDAAPVPVERPAPVRRRRAARPRA